MCRFLMMIHESVPQSTGRPSEKAAEENKKLLARICSKNIDKGVTDPAVAEKILIV